MHPIWLLIFWAFSALSTSKIVKFNTQVVIKNISFFVRNNMWLKLHMYYKSRHNYHFSHFYLRCNIFSWFFLLDLFMVQICSVGRKNFLLFKHITVTWKFFCKENVRLASVVNCNCKFSRNTEFINYMVQFSTDKKLAVELCVKSVKWITIYKRLKENYFE